MGKVGAPLAASALLLFGAVTLAARAPAAAPQPVAPRDPTRAFLERHCLACHNDRLQTAGLSLAAADTRDAGDNPELWEKVLQKLRTGQMPPPGRTRPPVAELESVVARLVQQLDLAAARRPDPGRVGVHRLNRTEYANAIRDLLDVEIDAGELLLADESDEGFDNVAASLALSPAHLERYLAAAREISRLAIGDAGVDPTPASVTYRVPKLLEQDVRISEQTPFGARGGLAVTHHFPRDGEYAFTVRLRRQIYDYIIGMGHAQQIDVRVDGRRVARFTIGGEAPGLPGPLTWNGEIVGDTEWELYMHSADDGLEVRAPVAAGAHVVSVSFVDTPWEPEGIPQPLQVDFGRGSDEQYDGHAAVDTLTIHGPYTPGGPGDTASRRAVFVCRPATPEDEEPCARTILSRLARRAYRRPPTADEVATLLEFYRTGSAGTPGGFEAGIQAALERMLVSFNFLFRIEQQPRGAAAGTVYRLSDLDLASRLSFFLWSSIPDDELLDLAEAGTLHEPRVLEQQVRRMLRDRRASALVDSFAAQWLGLRRARSALPDPNVFPEFDENLRRAMLEETRLFLEDQFRSDRSIVDLIAADYSFINGRLAEHYGVAGVYGPRFRKVTFGDGRRGGLLGQGSVLLATSYPDRTTPVLRGVWVLDNLLGMPPPPPPPNVPELAVQDEGGRLLSVREQLEAHRQNPACAVCHVRIDPPGFALENFDAIGRWRDRAAGQRIDASAVFADGTPLEGVAGLRSFLLDRRDLFVYAFTSKLLTYALGRHVDHRDQPAIRRIVREAASADYRWSSIVLGIVRSTPFQMRTAS